VPRWRVIAAPYAAREISPGGFRLHKARSGQPIRGRPVVVQVHFRRSSDRLLQRRGDLGSWLASAVCPAHVTVLGQ